MEKLSHAYIVSSPSEAKREEIAYQLAEKMLCSSAGERPCGVCRDCRKVKGRIHPDLSVVRRGEDDKGNRKREITVDRIRKMGMDAYVLPNEAKAKVYIIEDADKMNESAQNAALKVFEEPPAGVHFILCAANSDSLLTTVRSRCVEIKKNADDEAFDEAAEKMAAEYIKCIDSGNEAELLSWCMGCITDDDTDFAGMRSFLECAKSRLIKRLCTADMGKEKIMYNINVIDRCLAYLRVNTGVKHIFGLLAVKSLPAAETERKID